MPSAPETISLSVSAKPQLARLVRMTAASAATLSSMSLDRVEDVRMAAEEAFIYACAAHPAGGLSIALTVDAARVSMSFELGCDDFSAADESESASYADLLLGAVCDEYRKEESPAALFIELRADV